MEWVWWKKRFMCQNMKEAASNLRFQMVLEILTQPLIYVT